MARKYTEMQKQFEESENHLVDREEESKENRRKMNDLQRQLNNKEHILAQLEREHEDKEDFIQRLLTEKQEILTEFNDMRSSMQRQGSIADELEEIKQEMKRLQFAQTKQVNSRSLTSAGGPP